MENPRRVLYGHLDGFSLSALGRDQATAVGDRLRDAGIKRIVHSPLTRAAETAEIIGSRLDPIPAMEPEPNLREAEFSRYLQGIPFWQIPVRRPLWLVHKARRGLLPGDESIEVMANRVLRVVRRLARDYPNETTALVSHADPINAAWIILDGRPQNEREMHRKAVDKAGMLQLELEGEKAVEWNYIPPPQVGKAAAAAA